MQGPGREPRETFLGRTEKEGEEYTGEEKLQRQGGHVSDASRRRELEMGTFSSVNISARTDLECRVWN